MRLIISLIIFTVLCFSFYSISNCNIASEEDPTFIEYADGEKEITKKPPDNHTEEVGGFKHAEGYYFPTGKCDSEACHGSDLKGGNNNGGRSCYTCHGKAWF